MESGALSLVTTFFSRLWQGLQSVTLPGTDWPCGDFFIAIFTAGIVGKILMALFKVFTSHFDRSLKSVRRGEKTGGAKED